MICPPCATAADVIAAAIRDGDIESIGHRPEICKDFHRQPHGCTCQHGQPGETEGNEVQQ